MEAKSEIEQLEEELKQIKESRARVEQSRSDMALAAEKRAEVAAARQALTDAEALAKIEADHGPVGGPGSKLAKFETALGVIVVKRPAMQLFRKFQNAKNSDTEEAEKLVRPNVVYPSKARFDEILEELPGILTNLADLVAHLAGLRVGELRGKS